MSIDKIKWILYNDYKKHKCIKIKYICFAFKYWTRVLNFKSITKKIYIYKTPQIISLLNYQWFHSQFLYIKTRY